MAEHECPVLASQRLLSPEAHNDVAYRATTPALGLETTRLTKGDDSPVELARSIV